MSTDTPSLTGQTAQACPQCGASVPSTSGFVSWREHCGWNVQPLVVHRPRGLLERQYTAFGRQRALSMFEAVKRERELAPRVTVSAVAAVAFATMVHLATLICGVLGVWLLIDRWPNLFAVIPAVMLIMLAVVLRPRINAWPKQTLSRAEAPALFAVVDRVTQAVGGAPVDAIVLNGAFNASYMRAGLRQRVVLTLGLPLMAVLSPREQVALLAHEVAHGVNGDVTRGLVVGSAVGTLVSWYRVLRPDSVWAMDRGGSFGLLETISNGVLWLISWVPWLGGYVLVHLLWQDSQRAEYLADDLAGRVAGGEALVGLLEKLHLGAAYQLAVQRVAVGNREQRLSAVLTELVEALPERERERIRRQSRLEGSRLDTTHPPTAYRVERARALAGVQPLITIGAEEQARVASELQSHEAGIQRQLVDDYLIRIS